MKIFKQENKLENSKDWIPETSEENKHGQIETAKVQEERYNNNLKMLEKERDELMNKSNKTIEDKKKLREINSEILGLREKSKDFQGESDEILKENGQLQIENKQGQIGNEQLQIENKQKQIGNEQLQIENKQGQIETVKVQGERYNNELKMLEEERDELVNKSNKTIEDKKKLREINSEILGLREKSKDFQGESDEILKEKLVPGEISSENFQDEYDKIMEEYKDGSEARRIYLENMSERMKQEGYEDNILKGKILDELDKISGENKEKDSDIIDAEFKEMSDEIEKMKPAEKKTFLEGMANIGYKISEIKNNAFCSIYSFLSQMSTKSDFLHRYFNSYAGIYDKESKKAKQKKEQIDKGVIMAGSSIAQGTGTLFKYGRVFYDIKEHAGGGLHGLNPFRHITTAAMFAGRSAEAGKEMRFEYDSVKEKTRVKDEEKAMEEALNIYEKVYGKEGLEKFKKGEKASESIYDEKGEIDEEKEEEQKAKFEKAYKNNLPEDIKNRLSKMDFPLTKWYKIYFDKSKDTKVYIDRLIKKIDKIENNKKLNNEEKENKKQALLKSKEALLTDLDKMVGDDGTVDSISYYSRMAEKVSKGVATALIIDSVGRIAKAGWELLHLLDRFDNDDVTLEQDFELSETDKEVMKNLEDLSVEDKKYIAENSLSKYMENKEQKQFNDTLDSIDRTKIETDKAITDNNTANKLSVDKLVNNKVNTRSLVIEETKKVYNPVKVKIRGKINTLSEAVSKALHSESTTADVKNNFIHKWSGNNINIDENNRDKLLNQAIRKMSVANIDNDTNNDVLNLIHKGDIVSIDKHGNIKINAESGSGIEAKAVSELQLRENWADIEGAKHGFKPKEVSFGGDENNLGERSYDVDVNGAKVNIDSDGHFKATVEGEKVSGNISKLKEKQTVKEFIGKKINNAKAEIEANKIREKGIAEFEKIIGKSELTQNNAEKFGINFNDGLSKSEIAKIKFVIDQKLVDSPEQAKHIFKLSNKTGIAYDKPHFINAYKLMPDDIKTSKNIEKAEGFLQIFAGTKKQVGEGLGKLGISGKTWTKNVHGTVIVENAFGEKGVKIFLTEQKISCEKTRFLFGTKKIFNEKLSLKNLGKLKNIFGIKIKKAIDDIYSDEKSVPGI